MSGVELMAALAGMGFGGALLGAGLSSLIHYIVGGV